MLTAHNLSKAFGLTPILKNITFSINAGDRVGLIGPNGCGKTTLLRLLTGEEQADSGHVALTPSNLQVGYLAQGFEPDPALSLGQLIHQTVGDPARLETELAQLGAALAAEPERADLQAAYDQTLTRLSRSNIGQFQSILAGLGLDVIDETQLVATLSGGQKTRLALALVLLSDPQLLLLDEPTNHLDIPSQEVLQAVLEAFDGTILLVSHDRYLVDRLATQIWELRDGRLHVFEGSYNDYLIFRAEAEGEEPDTTPAPDNLDWVEELVTPPVSWRDQQRLAEVEAQLAEYELLQEQIQDEIVAARDEQQLSVLRDELKVVQAELARLNEEWEGLTGISF